MEHAFNTNIAAQYDVNIALLVQHFKHWTVLNLANKRNIHDGLCWSYDSVQAYCEIFHYWTRHQIEHLLKKAEAKGLIVSGNYNEHKYDRTKWYALTPLAYKFYEELQNDKFLKRLYSSIKTDKVIHKSLCLLISENSEMVFEDFRNVFLKIPRPIPDTNPDTDPNINNKGTDNIHNQTLDDSGSEKDQKVTDLNIKSDYHKNQSKKDPLKSKKHQFGINNILQDNPFQIPEQIIQDWIMNREKKRVAITKTAWSRINKELSKCIENNINPLEAFETMVASGWQSLELKYFLHNGKSNDKKTQWDIESVLRA